MPKLDYDDLGQRLEFRWLGKHGMELPGKFVVTYDGNAAPVLLAGFFETHSHMVQSSKGLIAAGNFRPDTSVWHWQSNGLGTQTPEALKPHIQRVLAENAELIAASWEKN